MLVKVTLLTVRNLRAAIYLLQRQIYSSPENNDHCDFKVPVSKKINIKVEMMVHVTRAAPAIPHCHCVTKSKLKKSGMLCLLVVPRASLSSCFFVAKQK